MTSNANKIQNDSHCVLNLRFKNSVTEELSKGKSEAHTVTNNGSVGITTVGGKKCAGFNGTDQYLSIPNSDDFDFGKKDFSIVFWVYPVDDNNIWADIINRQDYDGALHDTAWKILFWGEGEAPYRRIQVEIFENGDGTSSDDIQGVDLLSESLPANIWSHVAIIRHVNNFGLYVGGKKNAEVSRDFSVHSSSLPLQIASHTNVATLEGYIRNLSIHKGIARYTRNFTPQNRLI